MNLEMLSKQNQDLKTMRFDGLNIDSIASFCGNVPCYYIPHSNRLVILNPDGHDLIVNSGNVIAKTNDGRIIKQ